MYICLLFLLDAPAINYFFLAGNKVLHTIEDEITHAHEPLLKKKQAHKMEDILLQIVYLVVVIYMAALVYFCTQHVFMWRKERTRIGNAISIFRLLAVVTLATTIYLYYFTRGYGYPASRALMGGGSGATYSSASIRTWSPENSDLTASSPEFATIETTFLSKITKLVAMCLLILLATYRVLRRL